MTPLKEQSRYGCESRHVIGCCLPLHCLQAALPLLLLVDVVHIMADAATFVTLAATAVGVCTPGQSQG